MRKANVLKSGICVFVICSAVFIQPAGYSAEEISLPEPIKKGEVSVEETINKRRSVRTFSSEPLTIQETAQLLWAAGGQTADGITGPTRAYPSAGGIYPLDIYLVAGNVEGLEPGIYEYDWKRHSLLVIKNGDFRKELSKAAFGQSMVAKAAVTIVVSARIEDVKDRYGQRGAQYASMDAGHLGQNVHLQAEGLGLGTVMVGAFTDTEVSEIIGMHNGSPVYMMPVGRPAE